MALDNTADRDGRLHRVGEDLDHLFRGPGGGHDPGPGGVLQGVAEDAATALAEVTLEMEDAISRAADASDVARVLDQHIDQAGKTYVRALSDRAHRRTVSKRTRLREKLGDYLTTSRS